ncbi:MAG: hypothetical protein Q7R95_08770 [bacterium]|nr:hypothetical protein [bacterium]
MKNFLKENWFKISLLFLFVLFLAFQLYKEFKPVTKKEQIMRCLELGSDVRATACVKLLTITQPPPRSDENQIK